MGYILQATKKKDHFYCRTEYQEESKTTVWCTKPSQAFQYSIKRKALKKLSYIRNTYWGKDQGWELVDACLFKKKAWCLVDDNFPIPWSENSYGIYIINKKIKNQLVFEDKINKYSNVYLTKEEAEKALVEFKKSRLWCRKKELEKAAMELAWWEKECSTLRA